MADADHFLAVSAAVVTRNRPESLERCLRSVRGQSVQPWEVVISDDSDWQIAVEVEELARRWECVYLSGPRRGLYANRNHVALGCRGTHVRTVDDDHTFPTGHFAQCQEAVASDSQAIWTTGETSFLDGKRHATAETANQLHPSGLGTRVSDPDNNWAIADGSTIYPRHVFESGFRMIEEFPYGSSYLEFGALLYYRGYRSRCVPGALVEHHATLETLGRSRDRRMAASHLFASLAYNLFFRPNSIRAWRYALACLARADVSLLGEFPMLVAKARARWRRRVWAGPRLSCF